MQSGRKAAAAKAVAKPVKKVADPLYPSEKKSFRVGGDILVGTLARGPAVFYLSHCYLSLPLRSLKSATFLALLSGLHTSACKGKSEFSTSA